MIHQIGRKSRQQIHYFSGELCNGMGLVSASRFVEEAVYGITCSGSARLTQIGRALEEKIPLHATHKRLSRNLADQSLEHSIGSNVLKLGSKHINENTLLIVDPSDIQKKYAKKMQYLTQVRDGSEGTIGKGYWLCEVVGCEVGSNEITPLAQQLWSQDAPDFKSDNVAHHQRCRGPQRTTSLQRIGTAFSASGASALLGGLSRFLIGHLFATMTFISRVL